MPASDIYRLLLAVRRHGKLITFDEVERAKKLEFEAYTIWTDNQQPRLAPNIRGRSNGGRRPSDQKPDGTGSRWEQLKTFRWTVNALRTSQTT
jgi:hypothetical protein